MSFFTSYEWAFVQQSNLETWEMSDFCMFAVLGLILGHWLLFRDSLIDYTRVTCCSLLISLKLWETARSKAQVQYTYFSVRVQGVHF